MSNKPAVRPLSANRVEQDLREQIVQRARDMIPELVARQAETEARTHYAPETHEAFKEVGFYEILNPKKFGGLELDVKTYYRVVMALAEGCPSTGWQFCLGSCHAITICGMYDSDTLNKIFDTDEPFICAITARAGQAVARRLPDGDWEVSGLCTFASGIPYSSHFMTHAIALNDDGSHGDLLTLIAPRGLWTMLDDWGGSLGMKGSGSNSVKFDNTRIPADFVLENTIIPSHRLGPKDVIGGDFDNPFYYGGTMSLWLLEPAALTLGTVKGALAECSSLMATKMTAIPPIVVRSQNSDYQRWFGAATAKIATAEAAFFDACDKWTEDARLNMLGLRNPGDSLEMLSSAICGEVMELCWDAMQLLYRVAGTGAAFDGQRMQRIYRDISTARSHAYNTRFDGLHRDLSQLLV